MKYIDLTRNKDYEKIKEAAKCINDGGLVLFPTETVYGIGADGLNENAVRKIYEAKGRASDNPLILHISNIDMVDKIAKNITVLERKLMDAFWPGPFTIILPKKSIISNIVTGNLDTVAIRMPKNIIANKLIEYANTPIAAPSANISGRPSGTCIDDIYNELEDKMDYIIDGGKCEVGIESTVVKVEDGKVRILRPGKITKEQIEKVAGAVILDEHIFSDVKLGGKVLSPGMKYRHYAPNTKCKMIWSKDNHKMILKIQEMIKTDNKVTIICCDENADKYNGCKVYKYGSRFNKEEISKNIFTILRKADNGDASLIIIEGTSKSGIGLGIMNRLIRACAHDYIEID